SATRVGITTTNGSVGSRLRENSDGSPHQGSVPTVGSDQHQCSTTVPSNDQPPVVTSSASDHRSLFPTSVRKKKKKREKKRQGLVMDRRDHSWTIITLQRFFPL